MYRDEENEDKVEVMTQMAIDDFKENGGHKEKYGINCRCFDCQREKENKPLEKILNRFI